MSIGAVNVVRDVDLMKESIQFLILSTPIGLRNKNFLVKQSFNKILEFSKKLKHFRLVFE
jgi:hypothetical protein